VVERRAKWPVLVEGVHPNPLEVVVRGVGFTYLL
jgi:hypothetical protein